MAPSTRRCPSMLFAFAAEKWNETYEDVSETLKRLEAAESIEESRVMTMKGETAILAFVSRCC